MLVSHEQEPGFGQEQEAVSASIVRDVGQNEGVALYTQIPPRIGRGRALERGQEIGFSLTYLCNGRSMEREHTASY